LNLPGSVNSVSTAEPIRKCLNSSLSKSGLSLFHFIQNGLKHCESKLLFTALLLKTTGSSVTEFEESFFKFGYYRQAAWYIEGLIESGIVREYELLGYKWKNFRFIVAPKKKEGMPALIYEISDKTDKIGLRGGTATFSGKEHNLKGINELFNALCWHEETNDYSAPKWVIDANYTFTI